MKTITVAIASVIIMAVGGNGPIPFLVLCPIRSDADCVRFATANFMAQYALAAEFVRLNGIFKKRKPTVSPNEKEGMK